MRHPGRATLVVGMCAHQAGGACVLGVWVDVGRPAAVVPDALRFCFDLRPTGTAAEGADLEILEAPGQAV